MIYSPFTSEMVHSPELTSFHQYSQRHKDLRNQTPMAAYYNIIEIINAEYSVKNGEVWQQGGVLPMVFLVR